MSSSVHHIQVTKYNRRLQNTPMERVNHRNRTMLAFLKGKITTNSTQYDGRSFMERKASRKELNDRVRWKVFYGAITLVCCFILLDELIFALF